MKYGRVRDSRYAKYNRASGRLAQFTIPARRTANFNPMMDGLGQIGSKLNDARKSVGNRVSGMMGKGADVMQDIQTEAGDAAYDAFKGRRSSPQAVPGGGEYVDDMENVLDVAAEEVPMSNGLRKKAGAMLKNPYALGAGGLALAGAGTASYINNNKEQIPEELMGDTDAETAQNWLAYKNANGGFK